MSSSLKRQAVSGVTWTSIERFTQQVIQFVIGIAIARVLAPSDYGVIGMTAIFFAVAATFVDSGFGSALIQKKDRDEVDYSTCFYFNAVVGGLLYAVLWFASPAIADFYRTPILCDVTRVLGLTLLVNSLSISQTAKMTAEMRFKEMAVISIVTQLVTGAIGLYLAHAGLGVWSLVFQQLGSSLVRLLTMELFLRWRPKLVFSMASFRHLFSYGSKILCSSLINTIYDNLYTLVIGRTFSAKDVGFYNRGNQFAVLPTNTVLSIFMKVAFPLMSQVQDDAERLKVAYKKFLRVPIFILYPILFGLIALAKPLILVLLGDKWLPAVPLLQVLCIGSFFDPLTHINLNILYVKGRTDLVLRLELVKKPIAFILLFSMIPFGLWWLCFGRAVYGFVAYCFNCYYTGKFINFGFWRQMYYNVPVILKSGITGALCYACHFVFDQPSAQLLAGVLVGVVSYFAIALITKDETLNDVRQIILKK
ncbi:MAG: lipopolysaccharide biosynthesis protein [Marinilabiliaceae bacterium]